MATAQEVPAPAQVATDEAHFPATGSHACEQHWPSVVQAFPVTVHTTPVFPVPPAPPPPPPVPPVWLEPDEPPQAGPSNDTPASKARRRTPCTRRLMFMTANDLLGLGDRQLERRPCGGVQVF